MPIPINRKILPPILVLQSTLNKFLPCLPAINPRKDYLALAESVQMNIECVGYTTIIEPNNTIEIVENRCKRCDRKLVRNGFNSRRPVLDNGLGKFTFRIHRKRCPHCGEIKMDLSALASPHGIYHENYKRRARQHYMKGLPPSLIKAAMEIDLGVRIPLTTIITWIVAMTMPLRAMLAKTRIPTSGHWGYDETFLRIRGKKAYALSTIDVVTGFAPAVTLSPHMGRSEGLLLFRSARRPKGPRIESITMDGTANLGTLLKTFAFKHIKIQQCLTHYKWWACRAIKHLAGVPEQSRKPIPAPYLPLKKAFYDVFDSHDEASAYIALERLRWMVQNARDKRLTSEFKNLEATLSKIIAWQRDPDIPRTNNKIENFHQNLQYYRPFKHRMMTLKGAQRVADCRVFLHNFSLFPSYVDKIYRNWCVWKERFKEDCRDHDARSARTYYFYEAGRLNQWYGDYLAFWKQNLAIHRR